MASKGYGKKKKSRFSIKPSTIFLYLAVFLILFTLVFFTYNVINGEDEAVSSEAPFTMVTNPPPTQTTTAAATTTTTTTSPAPTSSDSPGADTSSSDSSGADTSSSESPTDVYDYDTEYFDNALFIGDSITTGLSLYGFLDSDNVFAQTGLAPSTALGAEVDGISLLDKIAKFKPKKIFIMLGTNSVGYADSTYLASSMEELIETIKNETKASINVIAIPPVTREAEAAYDNYLSKEAIDEYNNLVKKACAKLSVKFIDLNKVLSDSEGYYYEQYAEMDGIHFLSDTYKVMLGYLQHETSR